MTGYYTFKWRVYIIWRLKNKEGEMVGGGRGGGGGGGGGGGEGVRIMGKKPRCRMFLVPQKHF